MRRALYQILCWENTEGSIRVIQYVTGKPGCPCAGIIVSSAVLTMWSTTHSRVFPVLTTTLQVTVSLLWWPLCASVSPTAAQAGFAPGSQQPSCCENSKSTECEGHMLFCLGFRNTILLLQTQGGFFTLWGFHWLFFVITALVIASFCFQTLCKLWPFLLSPVRYEEVHCNFLFTYYDNFNLYCQTITLFFTPCSLIHKLKIMSLIFLQNLSWTQLHPRHCYFTIKLLLIVLKEQSRGIYHFPQWSRKYQALFW